MYKTLATAIVLMAASQACAQARIVESQPVSAARDERADAAQGSAPAMSSESELFFQVQSLQEEVLTLRGLVEQQAYELRRLKQQRMDDYVDLDRRLSQVSGAPPSRRPAITDPEADSFAEQTTMPERSPAEELTAYRNAIDLVLKQKKFDAGIDALQAYLKEYPNGNYTANAQYWLGQIYLQKEDYPNSKLWFSRMTEEFPSHQKIDEAKFKLGRVHDLLGEKKEAQKLIREVANSSNSPVAKMAQEYLNNSL